MKYIGNDIQRLVVKPNEVAELLADYAVDDKKEVHVMYKPMYGRLVIVRPVLWPHTAEPEKGYQYAIIVKAVGGPVKAPIVIKLFAYPENPSPVKLECLVGSPPRLIVKELKPGEEVVLDKRDIDMADGEEWGASGFVHFPKVEGSKTYKFEVRVYADSEPYKGLGRFPA